MGRRVRVAVATVVFMLAACVATALGASDFEHPASSDTSQQFTTDGNPQREDTPNDEDYDQAEDPGPTTSNLYDERFDLFGFPSKHTQTARYKDAARLLQPMISGFNAA